MAIVNQGYRKDLNLEETPNDTTALNNIGGAGISNDLQIIQNNLRNISTVGYTSVTDGFFIDTTADYTYTNDDVITISGGSTITFSGGGILGINSTYYVCNSTGISSFKLSLTQSTDTSGLSTVGFAGTPNISNFNFQRDDKVERKNLQNFVIPDNLQDDEFTYFTGDLNGAFDTTQSNAENINYFVTQKYQGNEDTTTNRDIKFEGIVEVQDPREFNDSATDLADAKSPGAFIAGTRAFSSDNNPWTEQTGELSTGSDQVTIGELNFTNNIHITGISTVQEVIGGISTAYTHKIPAVIDGETYYILLVED